MNQPIEPTDVLLDIHVPFCIKKRAGEQELIRSASQEVRSAYLTALEREMLAAGDLLEGRTIRSIAVGGGIATVLSPDRLGRMLLNLRRTYQVAPRAELTLAAAPETVVTPCLTGLNVCGFNRISIEALTANDELLQALGTSHNAGDIQAGLLLLTQFAYKHININLLYGIPGQKPADILDTLIMLTEFPRVDHITLRPLSLPADRQIPLEARRAQFQQAVDLLGNRGFRLYAAGRFAKPYSESAHTFYACHGMERIGLGLGAHSFVDGLGYRNTTDLGEYLNYSGDYTKITTDVYEADEAALMKRFAVFGVELAEGFSEQAFFERFHREFEEVLGTAARSLVERGLMKREDGAIRLTLDGMLCLDEVTDALCQ